VGFDLSYGDDLAVYPPGVDANAAMQEEPVIWSGDHGRPLFTAWKWVVEAKWIEDFKKTHKKVKLINATARGMPIKGIKRTTLEAVQEQYLTKQYDIDALVHTHVQELSVCPLSYDAIFKSLASMYDSLGASISRIDTLVDTLQKTQDDCRETPFFIEQLTLLQAEEGYQYLLEIFDKMRIKHDHYSFEFSLSPLSTSEYKEHLSRRLMADRLLFLKEVASLNQMLIALSVTEQQHKGISIASFAPKSEVRWR
jgi:hypothetical protein